MFFLFLSNTVEVPGACVCANSQLISYYLGSVLEIVSRQPSSFDIHETS